MGENIDNVSNNVAELGSEVRVNPERWISGIDAARRCQLPTSKGLVRSSREWLASIGVPCHRYNSRKTWLVDGELLDCQLNQLQYMKREGYDDAECYDWLGGFKLPRDG